MHIWAREFGANASFFPFENKKAKVQGIWEKLNRNSAAPFTVIRSTVENQKVYAMNRRQGVPVTQTTFRYNAKGFDVIRKPKDHVLLLFS